DLPSVRELRQRWNLGRIPFPCSTVNPCHDSSNIRFAEPAVVQKLSVARIREPGRHPACEHNLPNRSCPWPDKAVGVHRERRDIPRSMAIETVVEENRRDIL